jgi:hypothetical protein
MTDFNGRPVLVTGASGGLAVPPFGHLVEADADVIASGRSRRRLSKPSPPTLAPAFCPSTSPRRKRSRRSRRPGHLGGRQLRWLRRGDCDPDGDRYWGLRQVININARGALLVIKYTLDP